LLRDKQHGYTAEQIPDDELQRLAAFISKGQHDASAYIDAASKKAKGDVENGHKLFQGVCAACHGFDGKSLNFGDDKEPEYVGTVAADNPWETLHKIRNGQPGTPMPALRVFDMQNAVDVLSYAQTLPQK
jgi:thiosulfate dehydrogenase